VIISFGSLNFTYHYRKIFQEVNFTRNIPEFKKKIIKLQINYFLKNQGVIFNNVKILG